MGKKLVVVKGKLFSDGKNGLYFQMEAGSPTDSKPTHKSSVSICEVFGFSTVEDIFEPYIGKNISVVVEKEERKVRKIEINGE